MAPHHPLTHSPLIHTMALVRISKALIADVQKNIERMRNAEVNALPLLSAQGHISAIGHTDLTDFLHARLWGEHAALASQMPASWCVKVGKLNLKATRTWTDAEGNAKKSEYQLCYKDLKVLAPPGTVTLHWDDNRLDYAVNFSDLPEGTRLHREFTEERNNCIERNKVRKAWLEREANITQFLNKCKSLNEAIKLWEGIKLYIPQSYLDDVERTVVINRATQRKEQVTKGLDSEGLTAAAIAAKLAGVV